MGAVEIIALAIGLAVAAGGVVVWGLLTAARRGDIDLARALAEWQARDEAGNLW